MAEKKSNPRDINTLVKRDLTNPNEEREAVDSDLSPEIKSTADDTPQFDPGSFESVQSTLKQIEKDYDVSDDRKPLISKRIEEYFRLKENGTPSEIAAKWNEIKKNIASLKMKEKR